MADRLGGHRAASALLLSGAILSMGCGGAQDPDRAGPVLGEPAPTYAAVNLQGDTVSVESLRGRVVLLNLWATWCIPCRAETPFLQSLHERHAEQGLSIVGASMDNRAGAEQIAAFASMYGVEYSILHDPEMRGMDLFRVLALPGSFLLDREGVIRWMAYGAIEEDDADFRAALEAALEATPRGS